MSEAKFTSGKWVIVPDEYSIEIAELEKDWHICNMYDRRDNGMYDAHLIASAPEMYAFIDSLAGLANTDMGGAIELLMKKIDEAGIILAKARGE